LARIQAVFGGCCFARLADLNASKAAQWLYAARQVPIVVEGPVGKAKGFDAIAKAFGVSRHSVGDWKRRGAPIEQRRENDLGAIHEWRIAEGLACETLGITTSNHYVTALRSFGRWLVTEKRWPVNPFDSLERLNADVDVRRERRTLTAEEFTKLLAAARNSNETFRGLTGPHRELLYVIASTTGLRAAELASLTLASFNLDGKPPTVTVQAAYSKRRRRDELPLRIDVAERLRGSIAARISRSDRLWPGRWAESAAKMLRLVLAAAGIAYLDDAGCVFDFHAIRGLFVTALIDAGVGIKTVQKLARHSTAALTLERYARVQAANLVAAVESLPPLPQPATQLIVAEFQATGTDDSGSIPVTGFVTGPVTVLADSPCLAASRGVAKSANSEQQDRVVTIAFPSTSDAPCPAESRDGESRAARTRTGNQRIMSPLL